MYRQILSRSLRLRENHNSMLGIVRKEKSGYICGNNHENEKNTSSTHRYHLSVFL